MLDVFDYHSALEFLANGRLANLKITAELGSCLLHRKGRLTVDSCALECIDHPLDHLSYPIMSTADDQPCPITNGQNEVSVIETRIEGGLRCVNTGDKLKLQQVSISNRRKKENELNLLNLGKLFVVACRLCCVFFVPMEHSHAGLICAGESAVWKGSVYVLVSSGKTCYGGCTTCLLQGLTIPFFLYCTLYFYDHPKHFICYVYWKMDIPNSLIQLFHCSPRFDSAFRIV